VQLVFPEEQAIRLLRAAEEQDVAAGGVFSAGPGGVQVWSEPWNGEGGTSGSSVQLGSVEWTANAPTRAYITIHRCLVTRAGRARGIEPADLLRRVLALAGLDGEAAPADLAGPLAGSFAHEEPWGGEAVGVHWVLGVVRRVGWGRRRVGQGAGLAAAGVGG
jgi:hypothetical protein